MDETPMVNVLLNSTQVQYVIDSLTGMMGELVAQIKKERQDAQEQIDSYKRSVERLEAMIEWVTPNKVVDE